MALNIMSDMQYDVFISCKSEDYSIALEIYDFLTEKGFRVFFSEKDIAYVGDADYKNTIDNAIDMSRNLVVVASKPQFLESPWVRYEWNLFANEKLSGRKSGNLMTIVSDRIDVTELPIGLRGYQSLHLSRYKESICPFIEDHSKPARPAPESAPSPSVVEVKPVPAARGGQNQWKDMD